MIEPIVMALRLRGIHALLTAADPYRPEVTEKLVDAVVSFDPDSDSEYPSTNRNGVFFLGCNSVVSLSDIDAIISFYRERVIPRYFVWLSPCAQLEELRGWLLDRGFSRFEGTGYPTLGRSAETMSEHETDLEVRRVDREDVQIHRRDIEIIFDDPRFRPYFVESCGAPGLEHFLAFADGKAVSGGILAVDGDAGSLGYMATAEEFRGRGGQSQMIVARVNRAVELGCRWVFSETLTFLKQSLSNLKRAGFEVVYDKEVFEFVDETE